MSDDGEDAPPSRAARFFEMAKLSASMAGEYTTSTVKSWFQSDEAAERSKLEAQRRNGERLAETLGDLKGAVMKIGQMASVATDLLPEELAEPLEELQRDVPPMGFEVVAEQIERELGARPELLFSSFQREPFASASIGQVHRATTDGGRDVVVKVQYPGIDDSVGSDLSQLKMALQVGGFVDRAKRDAFEALFDEIEARLEEELDYCNEAENVRRFREIYAADPDVVVPEVVGERSSKRVLTLTEEQGASLDEACEQFSWRQKDAIGEKLFTMFVEQIFCHRTLHADPNPANYAFRSDGTVVLYDYGCIKVIAEGQRATLARVMRASLVGDWDALEEAMIELGARVEDTPTLPAEAYEKMNRVLLDPVLEQESYDYGDGEIYERLREDWEVFVEYEPYFQPPPGGVYVDRTIVGLHNILRRLECRVPVESIVRETLQARAEE